MCELRISNYCQQPQSLHELTDAFLMILSRTPDFVKTRLHCVKLIEDVLYFVAQRATVECQERLDIVEMLFGYPSNYKSIPRFYQN